MNDGLFDMDDGTSSPGEPVPATARDEQIAAIRTGLDEAGIVSQRERQQFVEDVVLGPVASLRGLTAVQARRVLDQLKDMRTRPPATDGSLWETREKDTWIDRL